jgi:Kef-type K+ transport system membrane component KefB
VLALFDLAPAGLAPLVLAAATIACAARAGGIVARRFGQPVVVGEIAAGLALGPSVLGVIAPEAPGALFPTAIRPELHELARAGIVVFIFSVGTDLDTALVRRCGSLAAAVGWTSVVIPSVLGVGIGVLVYPALAGTTSLAAFLAFMAVALSVTALPVLARIVTDADLRARYLGPLALTCAGLADAAAWCLLLVVAALATASSVSGAAVTMIAAAAFVVAVLVLGRPLVTRLVGRLPEGRTRSSAALALGLALAFACAAVTDRLGLHAILGAFVAGVAFGRMQPFETPLGARLLRLNRIVLLPVFFAIVGLEIDVVSAGASTAVLVAGAAVLAVTVAGKLGGTTVVARARGLPWREAVALGALMNTKGLTEIVVLQTGLELGVISQRGFTVLTLMALIATAMTVPVLRLIGALEDAPRRLAPPSRPPQPVPVRPRRRPVSTVRR